MPKRKENGKFFMWGAFSRKLAVCLFISTSFTMLIGMLLLYGSATREAVRLNLQLNKNNLEVARANIEKQSRSIEDTITGLFFDYDVQKSILDNTATLTSPAVYNSINKKFTTALASCPGILGMAVYKTNGEKLIKSVSSVLPYDDFQSCIDYFTRKGGIRQDSLDSSSIWVGLEEDPSNTTAQYCLVNLRILRSLSGEETNAVIVVFYKENRICSLYSFFGRQSFIMDAEGRILSAADKSRIGESADDKIIHAAKSSGKRTVEISDGSGPDGIAKYCTWLPTFSCYLVAVPDNNVLTAMQQSVLTVLLLLTALGLIFSFASAWLLAKGLTKPVTNLKQAMEMARGGDLSVRFTGRTSDEIGYLGVTFNILMEDIARYIQKIKHAERQKQQNEIRLLQSQINPHLLYNTLDSALCLMEKNDTGTVIRILEELSRFFKLSLSKGSFFVPIATEIAHIKSYMQLQKLCRNKQIELCLIGDPRLFNVKIMKMTLQPIIENAYMHAFEGSVNDGTITIELSLREDVLSIDVTDNGAGINPETLDKLRDDLNSPEAVKGFGLWNVNQRLKAYYSGEYGLFVDSEYGEFTRVTVTIPYRPEMQEPQTEREA